MKPGTSRLTPERTSMSMETVFQKSSLARLVAKSIVSIDFCLMTAIE